MSDDERAGLRSMGEQLLTIMNGQQTEEAAQELALRMWDMLGPKDLFPLISEVALKAAEWLRHGNHHQHRTCCVLGMAACGLWLARDDELVAAGSDDGVQGKRRLLIEKSRAMFRDGLSLRP